MKTTLILPDSLVRFMKRRAVERGTTLSVVVAEALRGLQKEPETILPPLPVHSLGAARVDVADRNALYQAMEGH